MYRCKHTTFYTYPIHISVLPILSQHGAYAVNSKPLLQTDPSGVRYLTAVEFISVPFANAYCILSSYWTTFVECVYNTIFCLSCKICWIFMWILIWTRPNQLYMSLLFLLGIKFYTWRRFFISIVWTNICNPATHNVICHYLKTTWWRHEMG